MNKVYKLNKDIGKSIGTMFRQYGRKDLGLFNNLVRYLIYCILILDILSIAFTGYVGFKVMNSFGPISYSLGLGYTSVGFAVEVIFTFVIVVIFMNVLKEIVYRRINKR